MEPRIDEGKCIGCGLCEEICPAVFQMGRDGIAYALAADGGEEADCHEAAASCPTGAIELE